MSQLPIEAQWVQLGATIIFALFVAFIGYRQWRTAHDRVIMDLFEKRFAVVDGIESIMSHFVGFGGISASQELTLWNWGSKARYLFGREVTDFLAVTQKRISEHSYAQRELKRAGAEGDDLAKLESQLFRDLSRFSGEFRPLVEPYMRMHHRRRRRFAGRARY